MNFKHIVLAVLSLGMTFNIARAQDDSDRGTLLQISDPQPPLYQILTLDDCLQIALSESPTVKIADMEVKRMDYSKRDVIGQLLPTIDFGATYNRMVAKQVMYMNLGAFGGLPGEGSDDSNLPEIEEPKRDEGIKMGLDNSYTMGFTATLPLVVPQLWKSLQLSDSQILRSVETARQSRQNLVDQVKGAYYAYLLALDSRKVIQESYDMARLTYDTYSKQYALGAASDYDVLRTSVAVKNIEPQLEQADIAIKRANLQLLILMGLDSDFLYLPAGQLSDYEASMYSNALAVDKENLSNNADLRLLDIDTEILKKSLAINKLAFSPTLAFVANYNWTSMSNGSPFRNFRWNPYSTVGLTLSVPIFQGGRRWNALKTTQIQIDEMAWQKTNLERSIAMQVELAVDNINMNIKQIASNSESVKQAERAHEIMERSFDIGAASYLDLRDSELALTQARLNYNQAIYNYLIAESSLELLLGNAPIEKYINANK